MIIVKASNPVVPFLLATIVGAAAFVGGMYYEREVHADYTVRVVGVPDQIHVLGAPSNIAVSGVPERIELAGGVQGIPDSITFKGTSLEGILPKDVEVSTAALAQIDSRHFIAITPDGRIYLIYFAEEVPGTGYGAWKKRAL